MKTRTVLAGLLAIAWACPALADDLSQGSTYHADAARSGGFVAAGLTWASAATMHRSQSFGGSTSGNLNAQPLYWRVPGAAHGMVVVATDQDFVQAFDSISGASLWRTSLGTINTQPVPNCNQPRQQGVLGTPVIDSAAGVIYVSASVRSEGGGDHYGIWALSLRDGSLKAGWPISLASGIEALGYHFVSIIHDQHTALSLVDGRLYAGFAANSGDCSSYHGYVIGIDTATATLTNAWKSRTQRAGVWSQGGVVSDGTSLFAATGNGIEPNGWRDGEAVFRFSTTLDHVTSKTDYFVPSDYLSLDNQDLDLGSASPLPVDVPVASGSTARWLVQIGKSGVAYVLDRGNLGGIGGGLLAYPAAKAVVVTTPSAYSASGAPMIALTGVGVSCPVAQSAASGLVALTLSGTPGLSMHTAWCASLGGPGVPIVTTSDGTMDPIVWVTAPNGDGRLHGYRGDTGAVVFGGNSDTIAGMSRHAAILVAERRLFIGGANQLYAFDYTPGM